MIAPEEKKNLISSAVMQIDEFKRFYSLLEPLTRIDVVKSRYKRIIYELDQIVIELKKEGE